VPDGCADLLIHDSGEMHVVGVHDHVDLAPLAAGTKLRGVRLRSAAVANAFGVPASELCNMTVRLDAVFGDCTSRAFENPDHVDVWLRSIEPDRRVDRAALLLQTQTVSAAADAVGLTERHLRRVMLEHAGVSPKTLSRRLPQTEGKVV
jgi:AraC-like DNA-binding protein